MRFHLSFLFGLAAIGLAVAPISAAAEAPQREIDVRYRVFIGGFPLGILIGRLSLNPNGYEGEGGFTPGFIIEAVFDGGGRAHGRGGWRPNAATGARPLPRLFGFHHRKGDAETIAELRFTPTGDPASYEADPPYRQRDYDMSITEAAGALDPISAVARLFAPRPDPCDFEVIVYDTRRLHRIAMTPTGGRTAAGAHVCDGVYERLAGFKPKHLAPDRRFDYFEMEIFVREDGLHLPRRVVAPTDFGYGVAVLQTHAFE